VDAAAVVEAWQFMYRALFTLASLSSMMAQRENL
jgi:hypothetical protein